LRRGQFAVEEQLFGVRDAGCVEEVHCRWFCMWWFLFLLMLGRARD
jgi:hypothetical protein